MAGVRLYEASNGVAIDLLRPDDGGNSELRVTVGNTAPVHTGTFRLDRPISIEPGLLDGDRLKSWSGIQAHIKKLRTEAEHAKAAALEAARDALRDDLANASLNVGAGVGSFLGIDNLPLLAAARIEARVIIDLLALDPTLNPPAETPVLTAVLAASGEVTFAGQNRTAAMRISVVVTREGLIEALPGLSVESLPGFPALDLAWPSIPWPEMAWPQLDLRGLSRILRLELPLPRLPGLASPLRLDWPTPPEFAATVAGTSLTISTTKRGDAELIWSGGGSDTQLGTISGFGLTLDGSGALQVTGMVAAQAALASQVPRTLIDKPDILPFTVDIEAPSLALALNANFDLEQPAPNFSLKGTLDFPRVLIRAKSDPYLLLALGATYEQVFDQASGTTSGQLTRLEVIDPYPVKLVALAAQGANEAAQTLMRLIAAIPVPQANMPDSARIMALLDRIADMVAAAANWIARQASAAAGALLGVAAAAAELLGKALKFISDALAKLNGSALVIELRLDARSYALRQIMISPGWSGNPPADSWKAEMLGLAIEIPFNWTPALLIDFDEPAGLALLAVPHRQTKLKLGTDLWLARQAKLEAVRETDKDGKRPEQRLIEIDAGFKDAPKAIALLRYAKGNASFLQAMRDTNGAANLELSLGERFSVVQLRGPAIYEEIALNHLTMDAQVGNVAERILPFLQGTKETSGASFLDGLSQYIEVKPGQTEIDAGKVRLPFKAKLKFGDEQVDFELAATLDLKSFEVSLAGGEKVFLTSKQPSREFDLLGLKARVFGVASQQTPGEFDLFGLDFSDGDVRLALAKGAHIDLAYGKVASSGRGLEFRVDTLAMSRGGLDLDARVDPETPVTLAGVEMPFRFKSGSLSIKQSQIQAFAITGAGQLPPELVGEANATITIAMGRDTDGTLRVQSAKAELDKSNDPIVCNATRFVFTLSAIGLEFQNFAADGAGYHFYFTLTGSAEFRPLPGEFADGMLKNLKSIAIKLDKTPLARDASLLLRTVDFHVAIEPKVTFNVFNLFSFELRGIGFHPASPAFVGEPAMSISGQVKFAEAGDVISPKFDFHKLWIAPPRAVSGDVRSPADYLPRFRFDGLTLGIRLGSNVSVEGTAIAVDESMPSLMRPGSLSKGIAAKGFLASGKLTIKGWGALSASMGFLELKQKGGLRHAFYIYVQRDEISVEIPTPVGPIYLREVGFGFGFRYTLSAFKAADQVTDVKSLIKVLDEISRYQGDLHNFRAWEPEEDGNRLTLALRGLISIASASEENKYNAEGEKDLPNPLLFDVMVALRSDLTFFMNARAWLCFNYADWHDSSPQDPWRTRPTLRGYIYLSVPRREFLGRMIADGTGEVGSHPKLPDELVRAMKGIRWSATTYIRPGLFHQEFGWPYELGFNFSKREGPAEFSIDCRGGMIQRFEDGAMLYGIAFKATGFARLGGSVGGRSFGASVTARADFSLAAKLIAYVSVTRFSDTLFYGSIAFDVTISLDVRVWLRFKIFRQEIGLEIGFSLSLTISIGLEVAVAPNLVAARGSASVGVSGFGRSIRLGIGFSLNNEGLAQARARVERFLSLGLTVDTPDPEQGASPQAEAPRGPKAVQADKALEEQVQKHEETKAPAGMAPPAAQGRPLQPAGYWAMLFPVAGDEDAYVMTFVPRDHSETGLSKPLPSMAGNQPLGTFYPPPFDESGPNLSPLRFRNAAADLKITQLRSDGSEGTVTVDYATPLTITNEVVARDASSGDELRLSDFLAQCYVSRTPPDQPPTKLNEVAEPLKQTLAIGRENLPEDEEVAARLLVEAGRDQLNLNEEQRLAGEIEERRSAAIAAFCDSAARLAAGGPSVWTQPAGKTLDIRHLGLAFKVTREQLGELFPPVQGEDVPRVGAFDLAATAPSIIDLPTRQGLPTGQSVHLFNPPERMFRNRHPRFAEPLAELRAGGIRLDWDLEPAFGPSLGVWHDPQFNLKHYRIERTLTTIDDLDSKAPARTMTTKAAAPLRLKRGDDGKFEWCFLRPNAQFVDDLSDLPAAWRAAILPNVAPPPSAEIRSGDEVLAALYGDGLLLRYVIVPIDTAGTAGTPAYLSLRVRGKRARRPAIMRATLSFAYVDDDPIRDIADPRPLVPQVSLGIEDPHLAKTGGARPRYVLRVRRERGVPTGLYGSDAVSDARVRPSAGDFALKRVDDRDFELTAQLAEPASCDEPGQVEGERPAWKMNETPDLADFLKAVGVTLPDRAKQGPHGVRFAIRPVTSGEELEAAWTPVDIMMLIRSLDSKVPAVAAPIEVFEHPVRVEPAPLMMEDMDGDAGRVLVLQPSRSGLLKELFEKQGARPAFARDPKRRVATRLRWNALPAAPDPVAGGLAASTLARFTAGFDVAEIDAGAEAEGAASDPTMASLRYRFSSRTEDSNPGHGSFRLDSAEHRRAKAIFISVRDMTGVEQAKVIAEFAGAAGRRGTRIRIVQANDPSRWITFSPTSLRVGNDYLRIDAACMGASGQNPLVTNNDVHILLTRDDALRSVARVQAVSASMARLDPAEVTDFSKVEAQYPSERRRSEMRDAGRQSAWYSAAESHLVWPEVTPRRCLSINVDETVITELLSHGRPDVIRVELNSPDLKEASIARHGGERQPDEGFNLPAATPAALRGLLRDLVLRGFDWKANSTNKGTRITGAELTVTALRQNRKLHRVSWRVDLDPPMHPVLADVIDWARYAEMPGGAPRTVYRRYEPVIEPLPKSAATDADQFLSETPAERDPFGWGVLRSLGLAVGLRLYDTERRDYADSQETVRILHRAFSEILPRYQGVMLGVPFVDLISRAGGAMGIASFDGGSPPSPDLKQWMKDELLAMTQIALRPVGNLFIENADRPVAYHAVYADGASNKVTFDLAKFDATASTFVIAEILDLTSGLGTAPRVTLVNKALSDNKDLSETLTGQHGHRWTHIIEVPRKWGCKRPVAWVRLTVSKGNAAAQAGIANCIGGGTSRVVGGPDDAPYGSPFGRFVQPAARSFAKLAMLHPALVSAIETLRLHVERRFPGTWSAAQSDSMEERLGKLREWSARFLEHGPATRVGDLVQYAIAEVTRPDPWRVGVGQDGRLNILITHDSRKRLLRRYAIKPFGRYDAFEQALKHVAGGTQPGQAGPDAWSDYAVAPNAGEPLGDDWSKRFFDFVIPRTEPVAPPVLLDAKRVEIADNGKTRRALEFLYARHPEEILSEANVAVDGALSFESVAVGLWREFPAERWAKFVLSKIDEVDAVGTAECFGDWDRTPDPPVLISGKDKFGQLTERSPDGWRGILALRMETLPYFFRIHAAAFAAAGVVVSKPVVGTIPEGHYELNLPWQEPLFDETSLPPRWSVLRAEGAPPKAVFRLPLVRFVDGMPEEHRRIWLRPDAIPAVFTLPSPDVRYEIRVVTAGSTGRNAASPELDIVAVQSASDQTSSGYRVTPVGPLFPSPIVEALKPAQEHGDTRTWWLDAPAVIGGSVAPVERFDPPVEMVIIAGAEIDPRSLFEIGGADFAAWAKVAPRTSATLRLLPPADTPQGWQDFRHAASQWRGIFRPYLGASPAMQTIHDLLAEAAGANRAWWEGKGWVNAGALIEGHVSVSAVAAGLPHFPDSRPAAIHVALDGSWAWPIPQDVTLDARIAIDAITPAALTPDFPEKKFIALRQSIRREMRALLVRRNEAASRFNWMENAGTAQFFIPSHATDLPEDLRAAAIRVGRHASAGETLPAAIDMQVVVPIRTEALTDDQVRTLLRAAEAMPETALAVSDLSPLEDNPAAWRQPGRMLDIHVPCCALRATAPSSLGAALNGIGAVPDPVRGVALLLRMPPNDAERDALVNAVHAVLGADDPVGQRLLSAAFDAMADQVFGPGGRPNVKVFHGRAEPKIDAVRPARQGDP